MEKKLLLFSCLTAAVYANAEDGLGAANIILPQNGRAELVINFQFAEEGTYTGYQFDVVLPKGISFVKDAKGRFVYTLGDCHEDSHNISTNYEEDSNTLKFACLSLESEALIGTSGILMTIPIETDGTLTVGAMYTGYLKNLALATLDAQSVVINELSFSITIDEVSDGRIILDENSLEVPQASSEPANVRVLRTINADVWSTICLPFSMTEAQTKEAFGEDVQLGDFTGYETEEDNNENIVGIRVNFTAANALEANHPYIIKVSSPVTEFSVEGVEIDPEDSPCVSYGYETGRRPVVYHPADFIGTYVANFDFYQDAQIQALFLSGNKFYYATENTQPMKAFRAYFDFDDVLTEVEEASVKVLIDFDEEETGLDEIVNPQSANARWFDLSGRNVAKPSQRGIYIQKGKKTLVK